MGIGPEIWFSTTNRHNPQCNTGRERGFTTIRKTHSETGSWSDYVYLPNDSWAIPVFTPNSVGIVPVNVLIATNWTNHDERQVERGWNVTSTTTRSAPQDHYSHRDSSHNFVNRPNSVGIEPVNWFIATNQSKSTFIFKTGWAASSQLAETQGKPMPVNCSTYPNTDPTIASICQVPSG